MPADQSVITDFRAARKAIEKEDSTQLAIILKRPNAGTIVARQIANPAGAYCPDVSLLTSVCDHKYCVPFCGMEMLKTVISAVYKAGGCELFQELSSDGRVFQCFCCNITIPRETALPALYQILEEIGGTGKDCDGFRMIQYLLEGNDCDSASLSIVKLFESNGRSSVAPIACTVDMLQRIGGDTCVRDIFSQAGFKDDLPFTACARHCKPDTIRYCVDTILNVATPEHIRNQILDVSWPESAMMAHVLENPYLCVESLDALFELVSVATGNSTDFLRSIFGENSFDTLGDRLASNENFTTPRDAVKFLCETLTKIGLFAKFFNSRSVKKNEKLVALIQASGFTVVKAAATATATKTKKKQPVKKKAAPASASKKKAKKAAPKKTATKKKAVTAAGKKKKTPVKKQKKVVAKKSKAVTKKKPIQKKK